MTDDLFADTDKPIIDPNKNYLDELVGEKKKFKTQEELARGKYESDNYIKTLEKRFDDLRTDHVKLREEAAAAAKLEELIDKFERRQTDITSSDDNQNANNVNQPSFDPKTIEDLVSSKLSEHENNKRQQANFNQVREKLKERYGNNYQDVLQDQINDLGLSKEFFNDLARNHPAVLYKTLGLDQVQSDGFTSPPRSSQNFQPKGAKKRTYSYYQELRKTDPKLYYDPKIAVQMHNDAIEQGEAFFDTK